MDKPIQIGYAQADITPQIGTPLSGFIPCENKPSVGIDSPIFVRILAIQQDSRLYWLINLELLAISRPLELFLLAALEAEPGETFVLSRCVLLATHTHSAPPASPLKSEATQALAGAEKRQPAATYPIAMRRGGYKVNDAWRFYKQPAPFMPGSEGGLLHLIRMIIEAL